MNARILGAAAGAAVLFITSAPGFDLQGRILATDGGPAPAGLSVRCGPMGRTTGAEKPAEHPVGPDGRFLVQVPDGTPQRQLWIVDSAGRARIGWPHLSRARDFGDVKLPADGALGGQLVAPGGLPVKGLRVVLLRKLDASCTHYVESCAIAAGDDGSFLFEGVPCGDHACRVESKDFAPEAHPIKVGAETYLEVHLKRGASIAGVVAGPEGPVAGVKVEVADAAAPIVTDAAGAFSVGGLDPESHRVVVRGGGWISKNPAGISVAAVEGAVATCRVEVVRSGGLRVTLKPEDPALELPHVLEFNLGGAGGRRVARMMNLEAPVTNGVATLADVVPGSYEIAPSDAEWGRTSTQAVVVAGRATDVVLVLPRTLSITGMVVDAAGKPVDDASVRMEVGDGTDRRTRYLSSDDRGRFIARGLSGGRIAVSVGEDAHLPQRLEWDLATIRGEQRIVLQPGLSLSGRVTDGKGKPLDDVRVGVMFEFPAPTNAAAGKSGRYRASPSESRSATTDADGRYTVRGLPEGNVSLSIDAEGYEPHHAEIRLAAGGTDHLVTLRKGSFIAGVVLEGDKPPASTFEVSVQGPIEAERSTDGSRRMIRREAETDASGAFRVEGLAPGRYRLEVKVPDTYGSEEAELDKVVAGTDDVLVSLAPKVRVPVLVLDPDGKPVAGAVLSAARTAGGGASVYFVSGSFGSRAPNVTDTKGGGSVEARTGGRLTVTASKPPLLDARATIEFAAAPVSNVVLRMSAGLAIGGRVVDAAGKPVEGLRVGAGGRRSAFDDEEDDGAKAATTGKDGRFDLRGLPAGPVNLVVVRPTGGDGEFGALIGKTVVVRPDAAPVEIRLPPMGAVRGEIRDDRGPAAEAYVSLVPASDGVQGPGHSARTDAQGRFAVAELPAGEYRVLWVVPSEDARRAPGMSVVTVKAGETAELKLGGAKPAGSARRLRVLAGDKPVAGASVQVFPAPPADESAAEEWMMQAQFGSVRAESDSNGWCEASAAKGGQYIVRADVMGKEGPEASYATVADLPAGDGPFEVRFHGVTVRGTSRDVDGAAKSSGFVMLVPSAMSDAHQAILSRWTMVRADGTFAFEAVPPGTYSIGAPAEEAYAFRSGIVVAEKDVAADLQDQRGLKLSGRVTLPSGDPAAGAVVTAICKENTMAHGFQPAGDDGTYEFTPPLLPGRYTLGVHFTGYAVETVEIDLAAPTVRDWRLVEGGGMVVRLTGSPKAVGGRLLRITGADGRAVVRPGERTSGLGGALRSLRTARDGTFHLKDLRPGRYEVVVDGTSARGSVEIKAGDTAEGTIAVP